MFRTLIAFGPKVGVAGDEPYTSLVVDIDSCRSGQRRMFRKKGHANTALMRRNVRVELGRDDGGLGGGFGLRLSQRAKVKNEADQEKLLGNKRPNANRTLHRSSNWLRGNHQKLSKDIIAL